MASGSDYDIAKQDLERREIWRGDQTTDWEAPEILRPLVSRLRRKLAEFPNGREWISNVRGTGYVFDGGES